MSSDTESGNGDLQLMAEYDFKDPVTATVLIYESDEELNTSTPAGESEKDTIKDLDSMVSKVFEDIIKEAGATKDNPMQKLSVSSNPSVNYVCDTFKHTVQVLNKTGQEIIGNVENNVNEKKRRLTTSSKLYDYEKSVQSEIVLSNSTVGFASQVMHNQGNLVPNQKTSKKRRRLASYPNTSKKSKEGTASNDIAVSVCQSVETTPTCKYTHGGSYQTITRDENHSNINSLTVVPQTANEVQPDLPTERPSQSQDDIIANQCLQKLLDTVSIHMAFIMKAHADYAITNSTCAKDVVESAKKRFIDTKTHFFYLSLSIVTNIIVPRANNNVFVENFIQNTVKIAHSRHVFARHSDMKLLFDEMCTWVKSHTFHVSILTELLNKGSEPDMPNTSSNSRQYGFENSDTASSNTTNNIFRGGPPGRELSINLYQNVLPNSQNTVQYSKQRRLNNYPGQDLNNMNRISYTNSRINCCNSQRTMHPSNYCQENTTQSSTYHYPAQKQSQAHPPYHQTWYSNTTYLERYSENQSTNSTHDRSIVSDQGQVETNRSLSRDSGFQSPLDLLPTDAMSSSTSQMDPQVTPLITHVTSLNPSVLLIKDGVCHVCGTLTKQKCLGCYKFYYCSHQCQTADWKNHIWICK